MSIQNNRLTYLTDHLLKHNLQRGVLPDSQEFIWQLEQALTKAGRNQNAFHFTPYRRTEVAMSNKLNTDHKIIHEDLSVLYSNLKELNAELNKEHHYFITEKGKLEKQIDILENRLRQHLQNTARLESLPYAYDVFDDTSKVNLTLTENLLVDTENNAVRLVEERKTTQRVYPEGNSQFTFYPEDIKRREANITGTPDAALTNESDSVWQKQIRLESSIPVTGSLVYSFQDTWYLNHLDFNFITVKTFELSVTYSRDGVEWFALANYVDHFTVEKKVALDFPSVPMKYVKLDITKYEADDIVTQEDGFNAHYLFGLESIAFYHKHYPTKGVITSHPLNFHSEPNNYAIEEITLSVDEWVPTGSRIDYEVALASPNPDWQPIDPITRPHPVHPQRLHLLRMSKNGGETLYFTESLSAQQAEAEDLLANGIPLYRLSQLREGKEHFELLPRKIRDGSVRLYIGQNAWEITSFPSDDVQSIPKIDDFQGVFSGTDISYHPILEGRSGDIYRGLKATQSKKYIAKLSLYLTAERTITARPVFTDPYAIYLNGELLQSGDQTSGKDSHFVFRPGWNQITILVNGLKATSENGMSAVLGFQPKNISDTLFARGEPLKEISLFDLQYNTKRHDRTVFSKRLTESGWEILTNFWSAGLKCQLYYDYKADNLPERDALLFRATFHREDSLTIPTPILRSYRLEST